jgi:hypothetical protein
MGVAEEERKRKEKRRMRGRNSMAAMAEGGVAPAVAAISGSSVNGI